MAYQPIKPIIPKYFNGEKVLGKKRDCKDFKPFFFERKYCKLSEKCKKCGYHCDSLHRLDEVNQMRTFIYCVGITNSRWQKIIL